MNKYLIDQSLRLFLFIAATILWVGIWLTGFGIVHWLLYVIPVFFYFAAITGICPGMMASRFIFRNNKRKR